MMMVSCATVAPLNVLTWALPVESIRRPATFLILESPVISFLQESGRRRAWVESRQDRLLSRHLCWEEVLAHDVTWWKVVVDADWRG